MAYEHTQRAPLHLLLHLLAAAMLVGAWGTSAEEPVVAYILVPVGLLFFLLGLMFKHLTVCDEGDSLAVRFGPLPLFGTRIRYDDIIAVAPGRSALIDGWGIHNIPGRGWTFNLWGYDCVELVVKGHPMRIGTDDVQNLVAFLRERTGVTSEDDG